MSSLVKSLPPLHDIAEPAGLDLPKYLGEITSTTKEEATLKRPQPEKKDKQTTEKPPQETV